MKQLILAAVAATLVFASAAQAAQQAPASTEQVANDTKMMSKEDCEKAMTACKDDQACKDALVKDSGCEAPKS